MKDWREIFEELEDKKSNSRSKSFKRRSSIENKETASDSVWAK